MGEDDTGREEYDDDDDDDEGKKGADGGMADVYSIVPDVATVHFRTVLLANMADRLPVLPVRERQRLSKSAMQRKAQARHPTML